MQMTLSFKTRQDWWLKVSPKLRVLILVKLSLPIAHLESICILLAYASHHNFKLQQMDVKSAFLNGPLNELVFLKQPLGFENPKFPNHVYKLDKALYALKQAPRAWYEHLKELLVDRGFEIGVIDPTLFTKKVNGELFN
jgi:hypothetical protein